MNLTIMITGMSLKISVPIWAGRNDIWYATNIEIIDYMDAARRLIFSTDCRRVYNPNAISVWLEIDGDTVIEVKGGTCLEI